MTLKSRLALLGVEVPERPLLEWKGARDAVNALAGYSKSLENACAQLAGEVESLRAKIEPPEEKKSGADPCPVCDGDGTPDGSHFEPIPCHYCGGTGRRP